MSKDLKKRVIFGAVALLIFLPFLLSGGIAFQIFVGLLAMLGTSELLRMKGLPALSIEGVLAMLASFVLTLPMKAYLPFLPEDGNYVAFALFVFALLAGTVLNEKDYHFEDVVYPIASSFYVGMGFHSLILARTSGLNKVLLALLIVWATDIGAYMIGRQLGKTKLLPKVSPNKTVEGSLGGIVSAVVVALIMMIVDSKAAAPYGIFSMLVMTVIFSVFGQFGDLVESAIKRHFGVKDSGKVIPGHGGILDRFDSLLLVFPIMHFFGLF